MIVFMLNNKILLQNKTLLQSPYESYVSYYIFVQFKINMYTEMAIFFNYQLDKTESPKIIITHRPTHTKLYHY